MSEVIQLGTRQISDHNIDRVRRGDTANAANEIVAEEYGLKEDNATQDWYDAIDEETGEKVEVKSCLRTVGKATKRNGRFRLWQEQLRSLHSANARGDASVAFALIDMADRQIYLRRVDPTQVTEWVTDRGGWNKSGHHEFDRQKKLTWTTVFDGLA